MEKIIRNGNQIDENDHEYTEHAIVSVQKWDEGWVIGTKDSGSLFFDECGVEPHVGDIARFYGKGFGYSVRGLTINGQMCYYYTEKEYKKKNEEDLYGKDAKDMLDRWDSGKNVFTIEMGGLGPGYEQAIQILVMELIRDNLNKKLPEGDVEWREWGDHTVYRIDKKIGGFSGAQVGAAKNLAYWFIKYGPIETLKPYKEKHEDRIIQVNKGFPSL